MPAPKMKAIIAAAENSRLAKMRTSSSARGEWSSHRMKATAEPTPVTRWNTIVSDAQPSRWPSAMPVIRPIRARLSSAKPSQSKGGIFAGMRRVGMKIRPSPAAMTQNGSEMKKT